MKKRIICIIIVLIMAAALLPVTAFAADTITSVEVSVRPPVADEDLRFSAQCPADAKYSVRDYYNYDFYYEYPYYWENGVCWRYENSSGEYSYCGPYEQYFNTYYYRVFVQLVPDEGCEFSENVTAAVNGKTAEVTHTQTGITVSYLFPTKPAYPEDIYSVSVTIPAPEVGEKPSYSPAFSEDAPYYLENYKEEYSRTLDNPSGERWCYRYKNNVRWQNLTDDEIIDPYSDYRFELGKRYKVEFTLSAKAGYSFYVSKNNVEINGSKCSYLHIETYEKEDRLSFSYEFPALFTPITAVDVTVSAPVAGETPDFNPILPQGVHYTMQDPYISDIYCNGISWYRGWQSTGVDSCTYEAMLNRTKGDTFAAGKDYTVSCYITPETGYAFDYEHLTVTVNGKTPMLVQTIADSGALNVYYTFPTVKEFTGWRKNNSNKWNYYKEGVLQKDWLSDGGKWYYLGTDGVMVTGWKQISGKWYYMNSSGVMQTGWVKSGGKWYYMNSSGAMLTGWQKISNKWYYLGTDGAMVTGWKQISGKWYYMDSSGVMQTGKVQIGSLLYTFNSSGVWDGKDGLKNGWIKNSSGKWNYYKEGSLQKGWQKIDGKWYYLGTDGVMVTGWKQLSGVWYYFESSGAMKTGWLKSGGKWYYFSSGGAMTVNASVTTGGKTYFFDGNGVCMNP